MELNILHLYPEEMNLYGDRGNVIALSQRARWRGIDVNIIYGEVGQEIDWPTIHLIFMGGGEDVHQARIASDFMRHKEALLEALYRGVPMLAICGAYQLLGHHYQTVDGQVLPGLGFFDVRTEAGKGRATGDVVCQTDLPISPATLVGFENHGGRTLLGPNAMPLGRIRLGQGNNGQDRTEGSLLHHTIGTYLHGSLLPKNPQLTDLLLTWSFLSRGIEIALEPLASEEEMAAHEVILNRMDNR